MLRLVQKICLSFTVLTVCLYLSPGRAQEVEASDELEQQSVDTGNRLLYIDVPVALEEGVDLAMTKPIYPEQSNAEDDLEHSLREQYIREYNSAVEEIEYTGGAWDRALVEELFALGLLQQQQGDHDAAVKTFDRAIHVNRINDGLYTLQQIPHVESMLDSYLALKDWQNADDYNNYLFFVQRKAFGANDRARLRAITKYSTVCGVGLAIVISGCYAVFTPWMIDAMTDLSDVRQTAYEFAPWIVFMPLVAIWAFQMDGIYIGTTQMRSLRNNMFVALIVYLTIALWAVSRFGNHGMWMALTGFMMVRGATLLWGYPRIERQISINGETNS